MTASRTCPACGYTHTYASPAKADYHFARHSCSAHRARLAAEQRRAQRPQGGVRRDCTHTRVTHQHGTRAAYVGDRCRCRPCMDANTAAGNQAHRARAMGRWEPLVDATPIRAHVAQLRRAGIGIDQIAKLAGLSASHVRGLIYTRGSGKPPYARVRPDTATRLMAITATAANRADNAHVPATGTRRRLQALMRLGWTQSALAGELGRWPANVARALTADLVTAGTAHAVAALYDRLWNARPPQYTPAQRAASSRAKAHAAHSGWLAPLAWDDIDSDPDPTAATGAETDDEDLDEIAIERAMAGDATVTLTRAEQIEVVSRLSDNGLSIRAIAEQLRTSKRTVSRHRRHGSAA